MFVYYKCYISIELTFLKELMLIKQVHQKSVIFVTNGISSISFQVSTKCLQQMSLFINDVYEL